MRCVSANVGRSARHSSRLNTHKSYANMYSTGNNNGRMLEARKEKRKGMSERGGEGKRGEKRVSGIHLMVFGVRISQKWKNKSNEKKTFDLLPLQSVCWKLFYKNLPQGVCAKRLLLRIYFPFSFCSFFLSLSFSSSAYSLTPNTFWRWASVLLPTNIFVLGWQWWYSVFRRWICSLLHSSFFLHVFLALRRDDCFFVCCARTGRLFPAEYKWRASDGSAQK